MVRALPQRISSPTPAQPPARAVSHGLTPHAPTGAAAVQRAPDYTTPLPMVRSEEIVGALQRGRGRGEPMSEALRTRLEPALGASLADVRLHTDTEADRLSRVLAARAFTTGSDVYFRSGLFAPGTTEGMKLLAHESAHVVQQRQGPVPGRDWGGGLRVSEPGDAGERGVEGLNSGRGGAQGIDGAIDAAPLAVQRAPAGQATATLEAMDATFMAWWREFGGQADAIDKALQRTRVQIGPQASAYSPPPRRGPATTPVAKTVTGTSPPSDDEGLFSPANDGPLVSNLDQAPPDPANGFPQAPPIEVEVVPIKIGGIEVALKAGPTGMGVGVSKEFPLPPVEIPLFTGIFLDLSNKASLVGSAEYRFDDKSCKFSGGLRVESKLALNGGLTWASTYVGGGLSAKANLEYEHGSFRDITGALEGSAFVGAQVKLLYGPDSYGNENAGSQASKGAEHDRSPESGLKIEYELGKLNVLAFTLWSDGFKVTLSDEVKGAFNKALQGWTADHERWDGLSRANTLP